MDEKDMYENGEREIEVQHICAALLGRSLWIGLVSVLCAAAAFLGALFLVTPRYEASVLFCVNNRSGDASAGISAADLSASRELVRTCMVIIHTEGTFQAIMDDAGTDRTYRELEKMVSTEIVDSTEFFRLTVTSTSPEEARLIAESFADVLPGRICALVDGAGIKLVDMQAQSRPASPDYICWALAGFAIGLALSAGFVVSREVREPVIRRERDIEESCPYPVLAAVPDMTADEKRGRARSRTDKRKQKPVGGSIGFAASEAYKLLGTTVQFSFPDDGGSRVIGVSSALPGEGKSLTAVNLACSLAQLGKRVLLVDADLRGSSQAQMLSIAESPGLSDFLAGRYSHEDVIRHCGVPNDAGAFRVITSGCIPPNPLELLGSVRMERMMESLRESYEYIILDLPPAGKLGDALLASRLTDGILLVVRQNLCSGPALRAAIRQFAFADARILGVVFNGSAGDHRTAARKGNRPGGERRRGEDLKSGENGAIITE